jgi:hypothetical protein
MFLLDVLVDHFIDPNVSPSNCCYLTVLELCANGQQRERDCRPNFERKERRYRRSYNTMRPKLVGFEILIWSCWSSWAQCLFSEPTTHVDDEYSKAGMRDPKILITTSRDPSSRLMQFAKVLSEVSV